MLKFIIGLCSFMIVYAILNLIYVLKKCYFKKTKKHNKEIIKTENMTPTIGKKKIIKIIRNNVAVRPHKNVSGIRLRTNRIMYNRQSDVCKQIVTLDRLKIDEKIDSDIIQAEKLTSDTEMKVMGIKDLKLDSIQSMSSDESIGMLKNETNVNMDVKFD